MHHTLLAGLVCLVLAGLGLATGPVARAPAPRAVWVARWDYRTEADVRRIMDEVASLGATEVIWQVRGQFDAYYESSLEPWAEDLFYDRRAEYAKDPTGAKPGFDPLKVATAAAHAKGLRLHAWINLYPVWKGKTPPTNPRHAFHTNPEWILHDDAGKAQPLNDHYVVANPANREVQEHLTAVCRELCAKYEVDGLHFDYVRFVSDALEPGRLYPGDAATLERFRSATGLGKPATAAEVARFRGWIREEISALVKRIAAEARAARGRIEVSAAVWRRPDLARETYLQDSAVWLAEGTLDRAYPMIYTGDVGTFRADLEAWLIAAPGRAITPGMGIYKHSTAEQTAAQVSAAAELGADGLAAFGYSSMFESVDPTQDRSAPEKELRRVRREALKAAWKAGR